jgi:hypothetical protein
MVQAAHASDRHPTMWSENQCDEPEGRRRTTADPSTHFGAKRAKHSLRMTLQSFNEFKTQETWRQRI